MKSQRNHARYHVGLTLAVVGLMSAVGLELGTAGIASAQVVYPTWSYTGNLNTGHVQHTATVLLNGKVLVEGGSGGSSAELYDATSGTWSNVASPEVTHQAIHTATLLPSGKVLVAGGIDATAGITNRAELFDPATGTWSRTGNLNIARYAHTTTLLTGGKVLVAGGYNYTSGYLRSSELYDPATGNWSNTGNLITPRGIPTATLLPNGKVLVAGGEGLGRLAINSAELYDPAIGIWSGTSNLETGRRLHSATLLSNGQVLVAGGTNCGPALACASLNSAELYEPTTGTWTITGNLNFGRLTHTATVLQNGSLLVAGGEHFNSAELYNPTTGTWSITAYLNRARDFHTATLLPNGSVLVAGGDGNVTGSQHTAELYDPHASPNANLVDESRFFVREHYVDFLDREPDEDGIAYWTNEITKCGTDVLCIHHRRIAVSAAFFVENEFQQTGYHFYRIYKASFGRQPNFTEFTPDHSLPSNCEDCSSLEERKQYFADEWVQREAFLQAYPIMMSNTEVVNKLFDSAGLTASIYNPQRQQEIQAMNAGRSRALVLRNVIEIPDFKNIPDPRDPRYAEIKQTSQYNPAFVLMQYFGYLRRNVDQGGYDFWLDVLNNREPNNYRGMVCAFLTSTEYQQRFGSSVTRSNADCGQ